MARLRNPAYSKIFNNKWGLSRFYAILVIKNWSLLDPDPKLIIPDPDPANNFGSDQIQIHNTARISKALLIFKFVEGSINFIHQFLVLKVFNTYLQ